MAERSTRRAYELSAGQIVMDDGVLHLLTFVQTHGESTLFVFPNNWTVAGSRDRLVEMATAAEIREARRLAVETGRGLVNFPTARMRSSGQLDPPPTATYGIDREGGRWNAIGPNAWKSSVLGRQVRRSTVELVRLYGPIRWYDADGKPVAGEGYAPPTGHAVAAPADTLRHDGRYDNGGTDA